MKTTQLTPVRLAVICILLAIGSNCFAQNKEEKFKEEEQEEEDEVVPCGVNPGGNGGNDSTYYFFDSDAPNYQYSVSASALPELTEEEILRLQILGIKED